MEYCVKLPKILYLSLSISKFAKEEGHYNTNDLAKIANWMKKELVRLRKDKNDYKFLDDTNFGGLRGNFSTVLTLRGYAKRGSRYIAYYGIGKTDRLFNAVLQGEIILNPDDYSAYTNKVDLKKLLEREAYLLSLREKQAHIKTFLSKTTSLGLTRDKDNFPKRAVVKTQTNIYFLRVLFNTYISENIIEYNMRDYLSGPKIKRINMHALFVIPNSENIWGDFYAIDGNELLTRYPLFLYFNISKKEFYDKNGNIYSHFSLSEAMKSFSDQSGNITERLNYNWTNVRENIYDSYAIKVPNVKDDEFSVFLKRFLKWEEKFSIDGKKVVDITVSSSGGADVILKYSGGTTQKVELEHTWNSYINHNHHKSRAWEGAWLYANENWDFKKICNIFKPHLVTNRSNIPTIFLCVNNETEEREAYLVDWDTLSYSSLEIEE